MALFFDSEWFDARLAAAGLKRADLGSALGLDENQMDAMWKDQREIAAREVRLIAALLGATPKEVAEHAGISTPVPRETVDIEQRLARIEADLAGIKALLKAKQP